jgi:WhiB family redox-sensing transcriptional regulator
VSGPATLFELLNLGSPEASDWMLDAVCAETDPEVFFPKFGEPTRTAKRVCASCPVLSQCQAFAVPRPALHGVWGGLSQKERQQRRRTDRERQRSGDTDRRVA